MVDKNLVERIQQAINYVEEHLHDDLVIEEIAKQAYMSQTSFYDIFSKVFDITIKSYITRRRLTCAAYDLIYTDMSVLTIGIKACYQSSEAFSRAFKKVYGLSPSFYRKSGDYMEIYPPVNLIDSRRLIGGRHMVTKTFNDDVLKNSISQNLKGYMVDIDIDRFDNINNNYGRDFGDVVLREVPKRIDKVLKELKIDSRVVRIAGDEFALVLKDLPKEKVIQMAETILKAMIEPITFKDKSLKVSVSLGIAKYDSSGLEEVKKSAFDAMMQAKHKGRNTYSLI